ncbi:Imm30 family immunity protein [Sphingomonas sp. ZT3P38]|uniref:Imm30 family immunity protein n=1 Tax=Parasphingomonas zepuensis TaxID=3096161 RepID=UPI003FA7C830
MLIDELDNLRRVVADGGTALEIDDALLPLITYSDPCIISPILTLLNESGDQDGMWSILHTAESFDGSPYVAGLLTALPSLIGTCDWWAQTLVLRVLNSETYTAELTAQLRKAPARTKEVVATICEKLSKDARFHAKAAPVLAATKV